MGFPGAGKTTLADELAPMINAKRLNADEVERLLMIGIFPKREEKDKLKGWLNLQLKLKNEGNNVIADFIAPTPAAENYFQQITLFG